MIDELVYDPGSSANTASFSLVQCLFVMVSGDVAATGDMTIETPVSTIGIRGTSVAIEAATEGLRNLITLLQDPDGNVGIIEVATAVASVILDTLGASTSVTTADQPPSAVEILSSEHIETLYSTALATMRTIGTDGRPVGSGADDDDTLVAFSTGTTNGDVMLGGAGSDTLVDGDGADTFTGGAGSDLFVFDDAASLYDVAANTAFEDETGPALNEITDFASGADTLACVASAFGGMALGSLTNGISFSVINDSYDGTNAGVNLNHGLGTSSFVYSKEDGVLFCDDNGAGAGYQAVADVGQPGANDIEIVSAA
ncbi:MAG: hypothetical protein P8Q36_16545 [Alphaproteobacteria bacterium]|nr:hypothetical protein [Rhodospirillaceae bacterium]MBT6509712.1 hypothetical protein [Rhodospirillaceae bacterium]MBT7611987.1 hypothetical protein [Rhodospirillaceae bacterium]MBT7648576.1 hypothetical protein [Rhodospirillaceae bacterium]MDG2482457.1 hypothetical protein [Alphaproteobacteria bacterium]